MPAPTSISVSELAKKIYTGEMTPTADEFLEMCSFAGQESMQEIAKMVAGKLLVFRLVCCTLVKLGIDEPPEKLDDIAFTLLQALYVNCKEQYPNKEEGSSLFAGAVGDILGRIKSKTVVDGARELARGLHKMY